MSKTTTFDEAGCKWTCGRPEEERMVKQAENLRTNNPFLQDLEYGLDVYEYLSIVEKKYDIALKRIVELEKELSRLRRLRRFFRL